MLTVTYEAIQEFLKEEAVESILEKKSADMPLSRLLIDMGVDEQERPLKVELYLIESRLDNIRALFAQFRYKFPFQVEEKAISDLARYILLINKTLEFSGFCLSEMDRVVYFRYDLYCYRNKVSKSLFKSFLGYLALIVDAFGPRIERIARGDATFVEVIQEDTQSSNF